MLMLELVFKWRLRSAGNDSWNAYALVGPRAYLMESVLTAKSGGEDFGEHRETKTQYGIMGGLGGEYLLGPGGLLLRIAYCALAIAIVHVNFLSKSLMPWIIASQTIPILAIAPMVIVVLGSLIAMAWNMLFNALFERRERRAGWQRTPLVRSVHAIAFEGGLVFLCVPVAAWWMAISYWQAFLLDVGILLFFLPYTLGYNLAYDKLRERYVSRRQARTLACS